MGTDQGGRQWGEEGTGQKSNQFRARQGPCSSGKGCSSGTVKCCGDIESSYYTLCRLFGGPEICRSAARLEAFSGGRVLT